MGGLVAIAPVTRVRVCERVEKIGHDQEQDCDRTGRIVGDHVPKREARITRCLLLELAHPVQKHVVAARAVTYEISNGIKGPINIAKHRKANTSVVQRVLAPNQSK
jgi:hypothetical protein